ncbi:hypothetical protein ONS95_000152 [Cadophora gregata]|uniref:uncharacterized protein n=1 Tax=Cadophora gregata TaxID=51156 RepID=UPI0026DD0C26|nr:uncharacterized protein ONS95_000152 [Cadophora gregata]KAK0115571.1 hypothetical protein ONS96_014026 [Cadophora gregata f. sp. sojae]KAK0128172.1 hypothetical protein ONS95_000152 [Cadophora gregata]
MFNLVQNIRISPIEISPPSDCSPWWSRTQPRLSPSHARTLDSASDPHNLLRPNRQRQIHPSPETKGDETFWKEEIFWDELDNFIQGLGLKEYHVLGQSWGGMMGSKWAGIRKPKGLRKLVISNSPADLNEWEKAYAGYRKLLPEAVEAKLRKGEGAEDWEGKEYEEALMYFFSKHMITVKLMPAELEESLAWAGRDGTVAMTMSGPDEFKSRGVLKNWSAAEACKDIEVPTLVINGTDEGASDEAVKPFVEGIKEVKWVKLKSSTHCPLHEEKDNYLKVVSEFLLGE